MTGPPEKKGSRLVLTPKPAPGIKHHYGRQNIARGVFPQVRAWAACPFVEQARIRLRGEKHDARSKLSFRAQDTSSRAGDLDRSVSPPSLLAVGLSP